MRIERRNTTQGQSPYAGIDFRLATSRDPQSRWLDRVPARKRRGARVLVAGRLRRAGAEVFPQSRRRRPPEEGRGRDRALLPVALGARRPRRWPPCPRAERYRQRTLRQAGVRSPRRLLDLLGLEGRLLHLGRRRARLLSTSCATCSPSRWSRRTRRSGSTPACTGPTASTVPARATITSIFKTGKLTKSKSSYEHPQPHACFIQGVE